MKKKIASIIMIVLLVLGLLATSTYATDTNTAELKNDSTVNLVQMKDRELETLQDYQEQYGDDTYGLVAYTIKYY